MNIADELQKLQALRDSGALTDAEFAEAKAKVISGGLDFPAAAGPQQNILNKFTRSKTDCWLGGVCGGLGRITPIPTWVWRAGFAMLICVYGVGLIPYICLWIFVPEEGAAS